MTALQQAAQDAIEVQNACNLSGVVHSFSHILTDVLWPAAREGNHGTDWVNQHPISKLFASKIEDLSRVNYGALTFSDAYDACHAIMQDKPIEVRTRPTHDGETTEFAHDEAGPVLPAVSTDAPTAA
jgi:hypothetical protein